MFEVLEIPIDILFGVIEVFSNAVQIELKMVLYRRTCPTTSNEKSMRSDSRVAPFSRRSFNLKSSIFAAAGIDFLVFEWPLIGRSPCVAENT